MPIQLHHKNGAEVYHRPLENTNKFSIFGDNDKMDYAYVSISDVERNNKGFYTDIKHKDPAYYRNGLIKLDINSIDVPVWTLPQSVTNKAQQTVTEESVTNGNKYSKMVIDKNSMFGTTKCLNMESIW